MIKDPVMGHVRLTGLLSVVAGADTIVVIVHGLSGNASSRYCASAARAAEQAGFSSLRLSLRGADYSGDEDVWGALAAPAIARYRHVLLLGYSVGGHIVLRAAIEQLDDRVRAAAAICPPLDLDHAAIVLTIQLEHLIGITSSAVLTEPTQLPWLAAAFTSRWRSWHVRGHAASETRSRWSPASVIAVSKTTTCAKV